MSGKLATSHEGWLLWQWRTVGQISKKCKETSNWMRLSLIWFILFHFVCLLKLILYDSKAQNQMYDWKRKCFCFVLFYKNLKSSFLYDTHIWLWSFFTLLLALAHGVAGARAFSAKSWQKQKLWVRKRCSPSRFMAIKEI